MRNKVEESVPFFVVAAITVVLAAAFITTGLSSEDLGVLLILCGVGAASCSLICVVVLLRIWFGHLWFWNEREKEE